MVLILISEAGFATVNSSSVRLSRNFVGALGYVIAPSITSWSLGDQLVCQLLLPVVSLKSQQGKDSKALARRLHTR